MDTDTDTDIVSDAPVPESVTVGWDVGLRDLASCVIDSHGRVLDWRVVDVRQFIPDPVMKHRAANGQQVPVECAISGVANYIQLYTHSALQAYDKSTVSHVIERQFNNGTMVAISHAIQCALEILGYRRVVFLHSRSRFQAAKRHSLPAPPRGATVKQRSLHYAAAFLTKTGQDEQRQMMQHAPAHHRDDYSDSLMLALSGGTCVAGRQDEAA